MATMVLATAGRAVGAYVGGAAGGRFGSLLGGLIGRTLEGSRKHHYEGARLETLAVQTSTYGRMIPQVFGSVRIAGNVIWSRPIKEIATTETVRSGGKGGGGSRSSSTSTTYSYYVTLAIAVCEGELTRIDRVWADAKLLDLSEGTYRVYTGTETQLPDPLIESYEGVGSTPAYRGLAYVVIEDFPMGDFGNRIPNFTFEVTRRTPQKDSEGQPVESLVKAIMMIPGSGEFVYDTQAAYKISGTDVDGNFVQSGYQVPMNQHTAEGKANVLVALDQMQQTFPNLEWVGVAANWFGTTMDIGSCEIWPSVEYQANVATTPEPWNVAGLNRATARQVGSDAGKLRYGGTPDDESLVRLVTELRARGLKVFFYPMLLMDVSGKPWRGYLTGAAGDVPSFFTKARGYNAFILHYATLMAGKIDAFAIGTEMRDLTKVTSGTGVFPAVAQLMGLANSVKAILGSAVKVTYAADWSEYHHTDGGWYHLDPLWASSAIDVVGIDAYFPLTDAPQADYDVNVIRQGWVSGEGYDWYYSDGARTVQVPLSDPYAWKNIDWWWNNTHWNPNGMQTAWVPGSKPIWFSEYGFASVDGCTNEPNVFVDSGASSSAYPRFSRGRVDFMAQRTAIAATEAQWAGSPMVQQKFLWTWDARPYPYWPDLRDVWSEGGNWVTGHWVQGKLGASHVGAAVEQIAARAGLDDDQIDTSKLQMMLDGFVLHERVTARAALQQLMDAYFFTIVERAGALVALPRNAEPVVVISSSECLPQRVEQLDVPFVLTRTEDLQLPARMEVEYLDRLQSYGNDIQSAQRSTQASTDTASLNLSLVLSQAHARAIAETKLADRWAQRSEVVLQLPMRYAMLEPGDVISLVDGAITHRLRAYKVQIGKPGVVRITAVVDAADAWDGYIEPSAGGDGSLVVPIPETRLEVLDMPALPGDAQDTMTLRFAACGIAAGWTGTTLSQVQPSGNDDVLISISQPATIGNAVSVLPAGQSVVFDDVSTVDVALLGDQLLANATRENVLNGANVAMLGNEVIQFTQASLVGDKIYRLSGLLRGRLGTEDAISSHVSGERFVLLDGSVAAMSVPLANQGKYWNIRATTYGKTLATGAISTVLISGNSLKPYAPVHATATRDASNGDIVFHWIRRARIDGGMRDGMDVPLMEQAELYNLVIYSGLVRVRSWQVVAPSQRYTEAEQLADFGALPSMVSVEIIQISSLVGAGKSLSAILEVR